VGLNSGTGFFSGWGQGGFNVGQSANFTYAADSLRYFTLPVSGGRLNSVAVSGLISGVQRFFVTPIGQAGTTVYLSVLLRPEGTLNNGEYNGFFGVYLNTGTELFIGKPGGDAIGEYVIENRGGSSQQSTQEPVTVGATAFLVLKAEFGEVGDVFTLYVNPPPVPVEPLTGVVKTDHLAGSVDGLTVYSTGEFSLDELRLGESYADVAPFVEPALNHAIAGELVELSWDAPGFRLERASGLGPAFLWSPTPAGDQSPVTFSLSSGGNIFFRLSTAESAEQ
jgi:hypothetical protein